MNSFEKKAGECQRTTDDTPRGCNLRAKKFNSIIPLLGGHEMILLDLGVPSQKV